MIHPSAAAAKGLGTSDVEELGRRFSLLYLNRGAPTRDSQRFRRRLAAYYWERLHNEHHEKIKRILETEAGVAIPYITNFGFSIAEMFKKGELQDVLDAITLIYQHLMATGWHTHATNWKNFVARSFREENVGYSLDEQGGVHYFVDEEFERDRVSALACLEAPRYAGVRAAFESAYQNLDREPRDTKAAVRAMFESLEILTKLMVTTKNLNKWLVENKLKEVALSIYAADETAVATISSVFAGFAHWVDGLHNYRHGQGKPDPVAPPLGLAIYVLSSGAAFLRWLVEVDTEILFRTPSALLNDTPVDCSEQ